MLNFLFATGLSWLTVTTLSGCSGDNIEVENVSETLETVNEVRLYTVTGDAKGKVILQEVKSDAATKYKLKFSDFTFPSCSGALTAKLKGGSNSATATISAPNAAFVAETTGSVDAGSADTIEILCDSKVIGTGTSSALVVSGDSGFIKGGKFEDAGTHKTQGTMKIYRETTIDAEGKPKAKYVLRFENIVVDEGPDVIMYFTPNAGTTDLDEAGTLIVPLDGTTMGTFSKAGNFNQDAPEGFDPEKFKGVLIWCRKVGVAFGTLKFTEFPSSSGTSFLKGGEFMDEGDHKTRGKMKIHSESYISDGGASAERYVLHFEDIEVDAGPDVALYFTPSAGKTDIDEEGTYVVSIDGTEKGTFFQVGKV